MAEQTQSQSAVQENPAPAPQETPAAAKTLSMKQLAARIDELEQRNSLLEEMVEVARLDRQQRIENGEDAEMSVELLHDPYDVQNPLAIKQVEVAQGIFEPVRIPPEEQFPEGQVLGWKSPRYRDRRGWRGWIEIKIGDKYAGKDGELLSNYLPDPPRRMEGESKMDTCVRRAGMVLARLDKRIWDARNQKREMRSNLQTGKINKDSPKFDRSGVELFGDGLTDQKRPRGGFKMGEQPDMGYKVRDGMVHRGSVPLHPEHDE